MIKKGKEISKTKFIDTARFIARSLSNLVNSLCEGIHKIRCKYELNDKKCETGGMKYKDWECFLECTNFKDALIEYKCLYLYNKNYEKAWWKHKETIF